MPDGLSIRAVSTAVERAGRPTDAASRMRKQPHQRSGRVRLKAQAASEMGIERAEALYIEALKRNERQGSPFRQVRELNGESKAIW